VVPWVTLLGCGDDDKPRGGDDADADADADTDADTDADADTDSDADHFVPATILMSAWFGYDAASGDLVDVVSPYGTIESRIRLEIGDDAWEATGFDGYATELYCVLELPLTGATAAPWADTDPDVWFGARYAGAPPDSDCTAADGYDVDPAAFAGYADLPDALASATWGVGVGELSPDNQALLDYVAAYPYAVIPPGAVFGGYVEDGVLGTVQDQAMAVAHPIDGAGFVDLTTYLDAADAHPPGGPLASGYYRIYFLYRVTL
jgi:hypothetical protein